MRRGEHTAFMRAAGGQAGRVHLWHTTARPLCPARVTPDGGPEGDLCGLCVRAADRRAHDIGRMRSPINYGFPRPSAQASHGLPTTR